MRRFLALTAALWCAAAFGCNSKNGSPGADGGGGQNGGGAGGGGPGGGGMTFTQTFGGSRDIDILFMMDDSQSMLALTSKLLLEFSAFTDVLQNLPGGLPNLHLGVVSSDLGAGPETTITECAIGGDQGQLQDQVGLGTGEAGGTGCTSTGLNAGEHFLSNVNGQANYDTTMGIPAVFSCIASLGDHGCGFEHQLQSVVRALNADGQGLPSKNAGFLRPGARLLIVLVTNEDDCSATPTTGLFSPTSRNVADPLGPLQSYRCNEFGHLCKGAPPPRAMAATFNPGECVSAESSGRLIPVATIASQIKSLKTDPSLIMVAAIAGPVDPYAVILVRAQDGTADADAGVMWSNVAHSCMQATTEFADPAVRIKQFVDAFGTRGLFLPICAPTYAGALQTIANYATAPFQGCLDELPASTDPTAANPQFQCTATINGPGPTPLPQCSGSGAGPCFRLVSNASCPSSGLQLTVVPPPTTASSVTLKCTRSP